MITRSYLASKLGIWTRIVLGLMLLAGSVVQGGSASAARAVPAAYDSAPNQAVVSRFEAFDQDGSVLVEWETAAEITTVGFYLFRQDPASGAWIQVNAEIVPGFLGAAVGGTYRLIDPGARPGGPTLYRLQEIQARGKTALIGPFTVTADRPSPAGSALSRRSAVPYELVPRPADLVVQPAAPAPNTGTDVPEALPGTELVALVEGLSAAGELTPTLWLPIVFGSGSGTISPTITVSTAALAAFVTSVGTPSAAQSYTVSGNALTAGISVSAPAGFEVATSQSGPYSASVTLAQSGGLASGTIWVRLAGTTTGSFSGNITHTSVGAVTRSVAVSGTVTGMAKLTVRTDGLYYLAGEDIASALGLSGGQVTSLIASMGLKLTTQGQTVATLPAAGNAGLYFYGQGIDSIYTWDNVYWLEVGAGTRMGTQAEPVPAPVAMGTFTETVHAEENLVPALGLFDDPAADYWLWEILVAENATFGRKSFGLQAYGAARTGTASLRVRLWGASAAGTGADHHVQILLNGSLVGEAIWIGATPYEVTLAFDPTLLSDGANTVEIVALLDAGVPYSVLYVDCFDLSYQRTARALNSVVAFTSADDLAATVYDFSGPNVIVFDLSNPLQPAQVVSATVEAWDGVYRVTFKPTAAGMPYLAIATTVVSRITTLVADTPSALKRPNAAGYVIVTTASLSSPAETLAAYRQAQGLQPMVVDIEDIYDEFNYGVATPHALRDFLAYAYAHWSPAPTYVLLAGSGSYDYKDYRGYSDSLVPPTMVFANDVLAAADGRYADVVGDDGSPEIAVGRLPVLTVPEFEAYNTKIIAYEAADPTGWSTQVVMLADNDDPEAGYFAADSDTVVTLVPAGYTVERIYLGPLTATEAHSRTLAALRTGAGVFNYIGHSGFDYLASEKLLTGTDVPALLNSPRLPFMSAATCVVGNYAVPGNRSLSMKMALQADGGAAAVFSPTGESLNIDGVALDTALFQEFFAGTGTRAGDATRSALVQFAAGGGPRYALDIYNLLGDPAMVMRWR